ncbi:MAG: hypothetical protein IT567_07185 [Alphaproteobacteria bacterium]|nr:hypothetical protein [Alphaproteobacteria bacterium]
MATDTINSDLAELLSKAGVDEKAFVSGLGKISQGEFMAQWSNLFPEQEFDDNPQTNRLATVMPGGASAFFLRAMCIADMTPQECYSTVVKIVKIRSEKNDLSPFDYLSAAGSLMKAYTGSDPNLRIKFNQAVMIGKMLLLAGRAKLTHQSEEEMAASAMPMMAGSMLGNARIILEPAAKYEDGHERLHQLTGFSSQFIKALLEEGVVLLDSGLVEDIASILVPLMASAKEASIEEHGAKESSDPMKQVALVLSKLPEGSAKIAEVAKQLAHILDSMDESYRKLVASMGGVTLEMIDPTLSLVSNVLKDPNVEKILSGIAKGAGTDASQNNATSHKVSVNLNSVDSGKDTNNAAFWIAASLGTAVSSFLGTKFGKTTLGKAIGGVLGFGVSALTVIIYEGARIGAQERQERGEVDSRPPDKKFTDLFSPKTLKDGWQGIVARTGLERGTARS